MSKAEARQVRNTMEVNKMAGYDKIENKSGNGGKVIIGIVLILLIALIFVGIKYNNESTATNTTKIVTTPAAPATTTVKTDHDRLTAQQPMPSAKDAARMLGIDEKNIEWKGTHFKVYNSVIKFTNYHWAVDTLTEQAQFELTGFSSPGKTLPITVGTLWYIPSLPLDDPLRSDSIEPHRAQYARYRGVSIDRVKTF